MGKTIENGVWKLIIKTRAGWKCELCENSKERGHAMHAHHIENKQTNYMRILLDNGVCLCAHHHMSIHGQKGRELQNETDDKLTKLRGKKFLDNLAYLKRNSPKLTTQDMEDKKKEYKELLNELG